MTPEERAVHREKNRCMQRNYRMKKVLKTLAIEHGVNVFTENPDTGEQSSLLPLSELARDGGQSGVANMGATSGSAYTPITETTHVLASTSSEGEPLRLTPVELRLAVNSVMTTVEDPTTIIDSSLSVMNSLVSDAGSSEPYESEKISFKSSSAVPNVTIKMETCDNDSEFESSAMSLPNIGNLVTQEQQDVEVATCTCTVSTPIVPDITSTDPQADSELAMMETQTGHAHVVLETGGQFGRAADPSVAPMETANPSVAPMETEDPSVAPMDQELSTHLHSLPADPSATVGDPTQHMDT